MSNSEKAELTGSICHTEIFSKSGIPIYDFEFPVRLAEKQQQQQQKEYRHREYNATIQSTFKQQLESAEMIAEFNTRYFFLSYSLCFSKGSYPNFASNIK